MEYFVMMTYEAHRPYGLKVTYANIQTWTEDKSGALRAHLTKK